MTGRTGVRRTDAAAELFAVGERRSWSVGRRRIVGCRPALGGGKTEKWRLARGHRPPGRGGGGGVGVRAEKGRPR